MSAGALPAGPGLREHDHEERGLLGEELQLGQRRIRSSDLDCFRGSPEPALSRGVHDHAVCTDEFAEPLVGARSTANVRAAVVTQFGGVDAEQAQANGVRSDQRVAIQRGSDTDRPDSPLGSRWGHRQSDYAHGPYAHPEDDWFAPGAPHSGMSQHVRGGPLGANPLEALSATGAPGSGLRNTPHPGRRVRPPSATGHIAVYWTTETSRLRTALGETCLSVRERGVEAPSRPHALS